MTFNQQKLWKISIERDRKNFSKEFFLHHRRDTGSQSINQIINDKLNSK